MRRQKLGGKIGVRGKIKYGNNRTINKIKDKKDY